MFTQDYLMETLSDKGYNPLVVSYKNEFVAVHRENGMEAEVLGTYDSKSNSLKPLNNGIRKKSIDDILLSTGNASHKGVSHSNKELRL